MAKPRIAVAVLLTILLGSNALWAYRALDAGVSRSYLSAALDDNRIALAQVIAVAEETMRVIATRDSIIAAASHDRADEPFEKDGFVWIGRIGLKFDSDGRLIDIERAWSPP
jgi:hypothetical protein